MIPSGKNGSLGSVRKELTSVYRPNPIPRIETRETVMVIQCPFLLISNLSGITCARFFLVAAEDVLPRVWFQSARVLRILGTTSTLPLLPPRLFHTKCLLPATATIQSAI